MIEPIVNETKVWEGELGSIAPGIERIGYVELSEQGYKVLSMQAIENVNEELLII